MDTALGGIDDDGKKQPISAQKYHGMQNCPLGQFSSLREAIRGLRGVQESFICAKANDTIGGAVKGTL